MRSAWRAVLISQAMPGRDEVLVLVRLQHVERLLVGEGGVIDVLDAVTDALLDRARGAGMRGEHLVAALGLLHRHRDLFLRHRRLLGAHAGDLLAGEVELDGVDAVFDELRTVRRISSGPETTMPRLSPSCGMCEGAESPSPPTVVISGPAAR